MRAKKHYGQHFLIRTDIAQRIADAMSYSLPGKKVNLLEIGGGTGVLTRFLLERPEYDLYVVEIDPEAQQILLQNFPQLDGRLIKGDVLRLNFERLFENPLPVIGNIPYNITGPLFFKILDYRHMVPEVVFMIQKEVALRLVAGPGTKDYGVLSVMLQSYYETEYLFSVPPSAFRPRPRVTSAVVRLKRREQFPDVDFDFFKYVVKTAFSQRRKTLRNSLKKLYDISRIPADYLDKRAEQLGLEEFWELSKLIK